MRVPLLAALALAAVVGALEAGSTAAPQPRAAQYACYPGQFSAYRPRRLTVVDTFARLTVIVRRPLVACAPAAVGATGPADPSTFLTCYEISARPLLGRRRLGTVSNVFGKARLTVASPPALCVSSSQSTPPGRARLTCYAVVGAGNDTRTRSIIADTFGSMREAVLVGRPVRFCTGRSAAGRTLHLVCYAVESAIAARAVVLADEWGALRASLGLRDRLCVQSTLRR